MANGSKRSRRSGGPYDVVFMDLQMRELDGLEARRRIIDEHPPGRRPRIVALTANALEEDREACLSAGMDDYLSKLLRADQLEAALRRSQRIAGPPQANNAVRCADPWSGPVAHLSASGAG